MSNARFEIKGALKNLNIAEPTRIPKEISFQPPAARPSHPQKERPQIEVPQNDVALKSRSIRGLHDLPQNEVPKNEVPQKERASTGGFFPLTHGVFRDPRLRKLSGDGFRVFLWLSSQAWLFPDSTGQLQAAVSWISEETAVSEASVSRILRVLQAEKLLRRVQVDYQNGNIWYVEDLLRVPFWLEASRSTTTRKENHLPHFEGSQTKAPQFNRTAPSKQQSSTIKTRDQLPQNEGEINKIRIQEKKNSLSCEFTDERLVCYFEELKPAEKRESERSHFEKLQQDYSEQEMGDALNFLERKGIPESGTPCHSPFAFLAKAMNQVLVLSNEEQASLREAEERSRISAAEFSRAEEKARQDAHEADLQERAFLRAFPSEEQQAQMIRKFCQGTPFTPGSQTGRLFAISSWWVNTN